MALISLVAGCYGAGSGDSIGKKGYQTQRGYATKLLRLCDKIVEHGKDIMAEW